MSRPGVPEREYVGARTALLNALEALGGLRPFVVLAGAQAVYFHVGEADLAVAPFTTDADLAVDPLSLPDQPHLVEALSRARFTPNLNGQPGAFVDPSGVEVDLLVPEGLAESPGRRDAHLANQPPGTARRVRGLEGVLVDNALTEIRALEDSDERRFEIAVAGPGALLVAKIHKIGDRQNAPERLDAKDGLDGYRLLRLPEPLLVERLRFLGGHRISAAVTEEAIELLEHLYSENGVGTRLAIQAAVPLEDEDFIRESCVALASGLLTALARLR